MPALYLVQPVFLLLFLLFSQVAYADNWEASVVVDESAPRVFLGVDKNTQTLHLLDGGSQTQVYSVATGQIAGDKMVEGDKKTPEGVYFVGERIRGELNNELYGNIAYSLNFPNPVDRAKGKTGYGIWLHGRGKPLVKMDTRGCVALNTPDVHQLTPVLQEGVPVVIAEDLSVKKEGDLASVEGALLEVKVKQWAQSWESRDDSFFTFYNPELFSRTEGNSFEGFKNHKSRLFKTLPWIHVMVDNLKVMQGPDYWVTWFDQFYRAGGYRSTVGKRLYWQKNADGDWLIIGREFYPASEDIENKYKARCRKDVQKSFNAWLTAWRKADLDSYIDAYTADASQGARKGRDLIRMQKDRIWDTKAPKKISIDNLSILSHPRGMIVRFTQTYVDETGYMDKGIKTLLFEPAGDSWKIVSEEWRKTA
ncbi:MAG: L,D-transpeptidase family protein [Desulfovibrio sp.]